MKSFSPRNLKYMRAFAEAWPDEAVVQQVVAQLPWRHQVRLLDAVKPPDERPWYFRQAKEDRHRHLQVRYTRPYGLWRGREAWDVVRLDIGSGGRSERGPDWLGVDAYVPTADVQAEMWDLPFETESVDEIYSSHALEHVSIRQVQPTLNEWFRVLKPGGRLTLQVPNLSWCMIQWLANPTTGFELMRIFGNQEHEGEYHKCGFTPQILAEQLAAAGFQVQKIETIWSHAQQTLSAEAVKPV